MSKRYVWKKYNKTGGINTQEVYESQYVSPSGSDNTGAFAGYNGSGPAVNGLNSGTLDMTTSPTPTRVNVGDQIHATTSYDVIAPYTSGNGWMAKASYSLLNQSGFFFWELYPYNSITHQIGVRLWKNNSGTYGDYNADHATWQKFTVYTKSSQDYSDSNLIGNVSSSSSSAYPNDGESGNYWYVYQNSDSPDPTSVSFSPSNATAGSAVTISATKSSNINSSYPSIQYVYQVQLNGGNWTTITTTSSTSTTYYIPSGTTSVRFRVQASDGAGWTGDYVTSSSASTKVYYTIRAVSYNTNFGTVSGSGTYEAGSTVRVVATPKTGHTLWGWFEEDPNVNAMGTLVSKSEVYTFTATKDRSLAAYWYTDFYEISISASPSAGGTVSFEGNRTLEENSFAHGESVTVIATPNSGYKFSHWLEGSSQVSTNANYTFTATKSRTLTAVFTQSTTYYTVTVSASPSAGGTVSGGGSYTNGTKITVRATANSGYSFSGWYDGNLLKSRDRVYVFEVTSSVALSARFIEESQSGQGSENQMLIGVGDVAKKVGNIYIGVNGKAKKVKNGYIGIGGKARLFYTPPINLTWNSATISSGTDAIRGIAYGKNAFVAVSNDGHSIYSANGSAWSTSTVYNSTTSMLSGVAFGNNIFVAISESALSAYSSDGKTWTATRNSIPYYMEGIAYGNGVFVAVGDGGAFSSDGKSWTESTVVSSSYSWDSVAYGNGVFVAVSQRASRAAYSTDGRNWYLSDEIQAPYLTDVVYGDGMFVATPRTSTIYERGSVACSKDGKTWTTYPSVLPPGQWYVANGNGLFVAASAFATTGVAQISKDGKTWKESTLPKNSECNCIVYGGDRFVAICGGSSLYAVW